MRWAFWRKEPEPPKSVTRRFAPPPPEKKGGTELRRQESRVPESPGTDRRVKEGIPTPTPISTPTPRPLDPGAEIPAPPVTPPGGTPAVEAVSKERLGEMLVRKGFISSDALDKALDVQRTLRADTYLGEILVRERVLTEEQLATTISRQYKIPFLRIDNYDIKKEILDLVPANDARRLRAVPIDKLGRILSVAMVNPLDEAGVNELQQITSLRIKPIICLANDMKKVLEMYYPSKKGSTIVLRRGDTPPPFPSVKVPPPAGERMVPDAGMTPLPETAPAGPVTGRAVPPALDTKRHPMSAPGPATILRHVTNQPVSSIPAEVLAHRTAAVAAEPVSEDVFDQSVSTHPETILRRGQPIQQGVRRKAIPATPIGDAEFVLYIGALPKK